FAFTPRSMKYSPAPKLLFRYSWISVNRDVLPLYEGRYEIAEGKYALEKNSGLWRYALSTGLRYKTGDFLAWDSEMNVSWQYARKTFMKARLFYGRFLDGNNILPGFQYGLSGRFDYQMDHTFFDRAMISSPYAAFERHTVLGDGGFRGYVPIASSSSMAALNFDLGIPQFGLFTIFADLGYSGDHSGLWYDAGVRVNLIRNVLEFNFPVFNRKSTRLNSSHVKISYAVFCLKKKKESRSLYFKLQNTNYQTYHFKHHSLSQPPIQYIHLLTL